MLIFQQFTTILEIFAKVACNVLPIVYNEGRGEQLGREKNKMARDERNMELWQVAEKRRLENVVSRPGLAAMVKSDKESTAASNSARYIDLRRAGLGMNEALRAMADEQGVKRITNCPAFDDELCGDLDISKCEG